MTKKTVCATGETIELQPIKAGETYLFNPIDGIRPVPQFENLRQIAAEYGDDWCICMPPEFNYRSSKLGVSDDTKLPIYLMTMREPLTMGWIKYGAARPHIDNSMSKFPLLRSYGPNQDFEFKGQLAVESMYLINRTHPRYGMNADRHGLPMPRDTNVSSIGPGTRVLLRFQDRTDREGIVLSFPYGSGTGGGETAFPLRVMTDPSPDGEYMDTLAEMTVDLRQVVHVFGRTELMVMRYWNNRTER